MNYDETSAAIEDAGYAQGDAINFEIPIYFGSDLDLNIVREKLAKSGIAFDDISAAILVRFKNMDKIA